MAIVISTSMSPFVGSMAKSTRRSTHRLKMTAVPARAIASTSANTTAGHRPRSSRSSAVGQSKVSSQIATAIATEAAPTPDHPRGAIASASSGVASSHSDPASRSDAAPIFTIGILT